MTYIQSPTYGDCFISQYFNHQGSCEFNWWFIRFTMWRNLIPEPEAIWLSQFMLDRGCSRTLFQMSLEQAIQMGVSKNNGTPKSSILIGFFHYRPSILGVSPPIFGNIQMSIPWKFHNDTVHRCSLHWLVFNTTVAVNHRNDSDDSSCLWICYNKTTSEEIPEKNLGFILLGGWFLLLPFLVYYAVILGDRKWSPGMMYFSKKWGAIWNPTILKITG